MKRGPYQLLRRHGSHDQQVGQALPPYAASGVTPAAARPTPSIAVYYAGQNESQRRNGKMPIERQHKLRQGIVGESSSESHQKQELAAGNQ